MTIRRIVSVALALFAVVFIAANLIALPFASFSSYSALWAQVYGSTTGPSCSRFFECLDDVTAQKVAAPFQLPSPDAQMVAVYYTVSFNANNVALSDFKDEGLTCDNYIAYRITDDARLAYWPTTCDPVTGMIMIPGTGAGGNIILYKLSNPSAAPEGLGINLSHGA
ncbi:MAG TPA: hypothetical protein VHD90_12465 [Phototrophicaceae bacterium]|nr:hypothetical protein [Phototrophicaceae bacterium]